MESYLVIILYFWYIFDIFANKCVLWRSKCTKFVFRLLEKLTTLLRPPSRLGWGVSLPIPHPSTPTAIRSRRLTLGYKGIVEYYTIFSQHIPHLLMSLSSINEKKMQNTNNFKSACVSFCTAYNPQYTNFTSAMLYTRSVTGIFTTPLQLPGMQLTSYCNSA